MIEFLIDSMHKGGPLMWPILAGAITAVSLGVWRLAQLRRADADGRALFAAVSGFIEAGDIEGALTMCRRRPSSAVGQVLAEILTEHDLGVVSLHRVADYATMAQRGRLSTHSANFLPTIAQVVVLCGLLGTIQGLMWGFSAGCH